ncbi:energy transducer TonB [Chryseobacterium oryctis]|uniref:Energy transducer TonB n=1 Tax=Chryseobacterium oryctis TaxID=2952618 RepID=A0ABT3HLH4_9FLAO|nr:energy transducer TonB [Chryseobacterium oryctis]MCW3160635.1 energy transducer TonB [Chryseobacterium oryctis]
MKIILFLSILFNILVFGQESVKDSVIIDDQLLQEQENYQVFLYSTKSAEFPQGIKTFRKMIAENFRMRKIKYSQKKETSQIIFIIKKDGTLTDIEAIGTNESFNQEVIRAVKKIKEKWIPAEINGKKARSRVEMPLTINFD